MTAGTAQTATTGPGAGSRSGVAVTVPLVVPDARVGAAPAVVPVCAVPFQRPGPDRHRPVA